MPHRIPARREFPIACARIRGTTAARTTTPTRRHPARSLEAEHRVHPEEQRTVADIRNQHLRLVVEPLLVPKKQEEKDQRASHQVVVEVFSQQTEPDQALISKFMIGNLLPWPLRRRGPISGSGDTDGGAAPIVVD